MSKKNDIIVTQDPENPIKKEILATTLVDISEAFKKLLKSGLNRRAIVVLLHDACPAATYGSAKVTRKQIGDVLDALENLKDRYTQ